MLRTNSNSTQNQKFKIATYNVLIEYDNKLVGYILDPATRFKYQIETMIPELDADVLSLNEVQQHYHK